MNKTCNLVLGTEILGGMDWGEINNFEVEYAVEYAIDRGINIFDSADVYGLGECEKKLSSILGHRRHSMKIISKYGVRWEHEKTEGQLRVKTWRDCSPKYMVTALESTLRRLRLDSIPLYFVHWPDGITGIPEIIQALDRQVALGKIKKYGLSNFNLEKYSPSDFTNCISSYQIGFNLLDQKNTKNIKIARNKNWDIYTYGPLAQGLLSGRYSAEYKFPVTDRRHRLPHFSQNFMFEKEQLFKCIAKIAEELNRTQAEIALRWVIQSGYSDNLIVGCRNIHQVDCALYAQEFCLSEIQMNELEFISKSLSN